MVGRVLQLSCLQQSSHAAIPSLRSVSDSAAASVSPPVRRGNECSRQFFGATFSTKCNLGELRPQIC
jgi:hypothetical protein